jgi:hypothetical protein
MRVYFHIYGEGGAGMSKSMISPAILATVLALLILLCRPAASAASVPILVELFTSEGCSDCPPADSFLAVLDAKQPLPGARLIVLEEHVDYWDDEGWRDPFSSHSLTLRQARYVERLNVKEGAYTPQMVVDGSEAFVGNNRVEAGRVLQNETRMPKIDVEISSVHVDDGKIIAHIATGVLPANAEVLIALALDHAQSQVLRGENGGRALQHVAVVRRLSSVGKVKKGQSFSKDVTLPLQGTNERYRVVVFAQEPDEGKVLGAAMADVK